MTDTNKTQESDAPEAAPEAKDEETKKAEQMCCDGNRTAAEHRHESGDGKCCSD